MTPTGAAKQFLQTLHDDLREDEYVELRGFNEGKKNVRLFSGSIVEMLQWIETYRTDYNLYVGVNPRTSNKSGKNEDIKRSYWVWIDIDSKKVDNATGDQILKNVLQRIVLPPSMVVYSGGGAHFYYRIQETDDLETLQRVINAFAAEVHGDPLGDPARVFRLPGTINYKHGTPAESTLKHCLVDYAYSLEDILAATQIHPKTAKRVDTGDGRGYESRSERDWSVCRSLIVSGMSDETIHYIFSKRAIGDKLADEGEKYLEHTLERARESMGNVVGQDDDETPTPVQAAKKKSKRALSERWTIVRQNDCMFAVDGEENIRQLATFTMSPKVLLQGDLDEGTEDTIICEVKASGYTWEAVPFPRAAFNRVDSMTKNLPAMAWQWLGSDKDVRKLLAILMDELRDQGLPKRKGTPILGIHDDEFVGPSQTMNKDGILDPNDAKMVWLPTQRVHPKIHLDWSERDEIAVLLQEFMALYPNINEMSAVYPVLGWYAACTLKLKMFDRWSARFPILNIFGTRGSGKTSLITNVMQRLFCYKDAVAHDFDSTKFVILSLLGSTNTIPVSFAEYRRSTVNNDHLERYIRMSYDLVEDSRGRADQTTQKYSLVAPFTVDGEDAISDPACLERVIQINLHPETIAEGTYAYEAFQKLRSLPLGLIGTKLIAWSLDHEPEYDKALGLVKEAFQITLPDRVRNNLTVVTAGLLMFAGFCELHDVDFPAVDSAFLAEIFAEPLDNVVNPNTGRTSLMVDEFITDIINAVSQSVDQRPPAFAHRYTKNDNILYFQLSSAVKWWYTERARSRQEVRDVAALKSQLREKTRLSKNGGGVLEKGFYILEPKTIPIDKKPTYVYPISIDAAVEAGLDIPNNLSRLHEELT